MDSLDLSVINLTPYLHLIYEIKLTDKIPVGDTSHPASVFFVGNIPRIAKLL